MINSRLHERLTSILIVLFIAGVVALVTDRVTATVVTENAWVIDKHSYIQANAETPYQIPDTHEAAIQTQGERSVIPVDRHTYERLPFDHQITVKTATGGISNHRYTSWVHRLYPTVYHHSVVQNDLNQKTLMNRQDLHELLTDNNFKQLESHVADAFYRKIHSNNKFKYYVQVKFNGYDKAISINGIDPLKWLEKQGLSPEDEV